jgi:hypothetical protein
MASRVRTAARACALGLALAACGSIGRSGEPGPGDAATPAGPVHVDDSGRRYVVRTIARADATPSAAGKVRTRNGIELELAGEDAASWHYKLYLPDERVRRSAGPAAAPAPSPPAPAIRESDALRFELVGAGLPRQGQWREGFDLADVDGDGNVDVVHGPARKGRPVPHVWRGDGRGGFAEWSDVRFPALAYDYGDARAADFDGDGRVDLALGVHLRGLLVLLGDGRGAFRAAGAGLGWADAGAPFSSRALRAADLDGDGRVDLAALGEGPRLAPGARSDGARSVVAGAQGVALFRGLGDGAFERRAAGADAHGIFGTSLALADVDGDGRLDVATGSSQLGRQDLVQLARGAGAFEPIAVGGVRPRSYVRAVAAADLDRDGRADLALAYVSIATGTWWSGVDVLLSAGSPGIAAPGARRVELAAREGRLDFRSLAAGDLDADGALDLAALDAAGAIAVFRGDGRGNFTVERETPAPFPGGPCRGSHLAIEDLDRDGLDDLVASFGQEPAPDGAAACPGQGGLAAWRSVGHAPGR